MKNQFHLKSYLLGVVACMFAYYLTNFIFHDEEDKREHEVGFILTRDIPDKEVPCPCEKCVEKRAHTAAN